MYELPNMLGVEGYAPLTPKLFKGQYISEIEGRVEPHRGSSSGDLAWRRFHVSFWIY